MRAAAAIFMIMFCYYLVLLLRSADCCVLCRRYGLVLCSERIMCQKIMERRVEVEGSS